MIQLRWLEQADGSDVKKLQYRQTSHGFWGEWREVPTEHYVKGDTESSPILPLAKEQHK